MVNHEPLPVTLHKYIRGRQQRACSFATRKPNLLRLNSDHYRAVAVLPDRRLRHVDRKRREPVEKVFIATSDGVPSDHWGLAHAENVEDLTVMVPHTAERNDIPADTAE